MQISKKLKQENIAEYLLYMWQVEDLVRAYNYDLDAIETNYLLKFQMNDDDFRTTSEWYGNIIDMMREEGVKEKGHIQINKNIIILLNDLHVQLMKSPKYPFYSSAYYKALPLIVELRSKSNENDKNELETCFEALYGVMMLKMQGRAVSEETSKAVATISQFIGLLADYYKKDKEKPLEF